MARTPRATQAVTGRRAAVQGGKGTQDDTRSTNDNAGKLPTVVHTNESSYAAKTVRREALPKRSDLR